MKSYHINDMRQPHDLNPASKRIASHIGPRLPAGGGVDAEWASPAVWKKGIFGTSGPVLLRVEEKPIRSFVNGDGVAKYEPTNLVKAQLTPTKLIDDMARVLGANVKQILDFSFYDEYQEPWNILVNFEDFNREIASKYTCNIPITPHKLTEIPHTKLHQKDCPKFFESLVEF